MPGFIMSMRGAAISFGATSRHLSTAVLTFLGMSLFIGYMDTYRTASNWEDNLIDYEIELVLIRKNTPLSVILTTSPNWELVYEDHNTHIFAPPN